MPLVKGTIEQTLNADGTVKQARQEFEKWELEPHTIVYAMEALRCLVDGDCEPPDVADAERALRELEQANSLLNEWEGREFSDGRTTNDGKKKLRAKGIAGCFNYGADLVGRSLAKGGNGLGVDKKRAATSRFVLVKPPTDPLFVAYITKAQEGPKVLNAWLDEVYAKNTGEIGRLLNP